MSKLLDPALDGVKERMLKAREARKKKKKEASVSPPSLVSPSISPEIGVNIFEHVPKVLEDLYTKGVRVIRMDIPASMEPALEDYMRTLGWGGARRKRSHHEFSGELHGIVFSITPDTAEYIQLSTRGIMDGLPQIYRLGPDGVLSLSPDYPSTSSAVPAPQLRWKNSFVDAKEIKVAIPIPAAPPPEPLLVEVRERFMTPRDALGPGPNLMREAFLTTASWPEHILLSDMSGLDTRLARFVEEDNKLYFWLANGCAVYDVAMSLDSPHFVGTLLHGSVFSDLPTSITPTTKE